MDDSHLATAGCSRDGHGYHSACPLAVGGGTSEGSLWRGSLWRAIRRLRRVTLGHVEEGADLVREIARFQPLGEIRDCNLEHRSTVEK